MIIQDAEELFALPQIEEVEIFPYPGVKQFFYSSVPYKGKPTKVFACCGFPENASAEAPVPGVVLIHGGGATALANWVELWVQRGYAAIAMDCCGCVPCWAANPYHHPWPRHEFAGPPGWGKMELAFDEVTDQWVYHALTAAILGNTLLRSFPQVDDRNIGVSGISWGGVLTLLAAAHDHRFRFAISVYGCGFFNTPDSVLPYSDPAVSDLHRSRWFELFDPGHTLDKITIPCMLLAGTNDAAFPAGSLWKSVRKLNSCRQLTVYKEYPHNHTISWQEETIWNFADSVLHDRYLPGVPETCLQHEQLTATLENLPYAVKSAELVYTCSKGLWRFKHWEKAPAKVKFQCGQAEISASLPRLLTTGFFNITLSDGSTISSMPFSSEQY
ncbi:MAG: hypothetical protein E7052_07370 [Lentisphaerae bacterium]|nr:hypothetical protein [Lentisphaerota bacterium]